MEITVINLIKDNYNVNIESQDVKGDVPTGHFRLTLSKYFPKSGFRHEACILPFDHITNEKIGKYLQLMERTLTDKLKL